MKIIEKLAEVEAVYSGRYDPYSLMDEDLREPLKALKALKDVVERLVQWSRTESLEITEE